MIIKVNSKNEYKFFPSIGAENDERPEAEKFTVILRRLSAVIHSGEWANIDADTGKVDVNIVNRVDSHIVRLENAPQLENEQGKTWDMDKKALLNGEHPELFGIVQQINAEINSMDNRDAELEIKNS